MLAERGAAEHPRDHAPASHSRKQPQAHLVHQVHNEAIVVTETIDAIRALTGAAPDAATSIRLTDLALGMRRDFLKSGDEGKR